MRHLKIRMIALLLTIIGDELQNLCVSILDDSKKDMNKSIDDIIEYISSPGHSDIDSLDYADQCGRTGERDAVQCLYKWAQKSEHSDQSQDAGGYRRA